MSGLSKTKDISLRSPRLKHELGRFEAVESSSINAFAAPDVIPKPGPGGDIGALDASSLSGSETVNITTINASLPISDQELRDLGYLLVDDYAGVDPTGVADSVSGINQAMLDGKDQLKPVWFSSEGVYRVSDTIRCGLWADGDRLQVYGGGEGVNRAKVILDDSATGFGSSSIPRPVVCWRMFSKGAADNVWPSDPMDEAAPYEGQANIVFYANWRNIDIDCGNNAGAFGMYFPAAQRCDAGDIIITVTNALGGWWGLLGRNCPIYNLTVIGGVWQVRNDGSSRTSEASGGSLLVGLNLIGDSRTTSPIETDDFVPLTIVGFNISRTTAGAFVVIQSQTRTGYCSIVLIDGKITSVGGTVIDNIVGKNIYIRNTYVTGTNDLIQSKAESVITGSGTWKRIDEYVYNDVTALNASAAQYPTESLIDGVLDASTEEPATSITSSVAMPTVDYIARHTITVPRVDSGPFINILNEGALGNPEELSNRYSNNNDNDTMDSRSAIQAAIDSAEAAGHNTVVIPRGVYYVGSPGLALKPDTVLIGIGSIYAIVGTHGSWQPTSKTFVIRSADDANGTAHFSNIGISTRTVDGTGGGEVTPYQFDHFSFMEWRTGKNSSSIITNNHREFQAPGNICHPKDYYSYSGNAGGKHYSLSDAQGRRNGNADSRSIRITSTSEPLHLYGCNMEITKRSVQDADYNLEIQGASNIRLYGCKREGDAGTSLINDVTNVALYGFGRQESDTVEDIHLIEGTSDGVLIAISTRDLTDGVTGGEGNPREARDATAAVQIDYPKGCSIYKRGTIDDSAVTI